eukprot:CAMPEP_0194545492 /NCGR_PEP_ID=MMETSP0253-20130528/89273_1 /TAXON_ID=2966 /ORGANISM="Noctiluca scintillans" /LENGTH=125 /DNA_ID=CAMNT_0039392491 /DNA_START=9 /DNA_END=386 /DNA_ORIENTATION=+
MSILSCPCCSPESKPDESTIEIYDANPMEFDPDELSPQAFTVYLDRSSGTRLGVFVKEVDHMMQIVQLEEGRTAVTQWNAANREQIVVGDFIISVDGGTRREEIQAGCQQWRVLEVELKRATLEQ